MCDEIILKTQAGGIPYADEDATRPDVTSRAVASWLTSKGLTNAEEDACSRNVQSFTTFRASGPSRIAKRELPTADEDDDGTMSNRWESSKQRYDRQSSVLSKRDRHAGVKVEAESALQRYENAVLKYQKPKLRPKRQISREQQQQQQQQRQQQSNNYSSSDESVARNKSKSTSSIDTQSVNNILDEYEDLDYRRSSDLSDVGSINVTNFEAVMMDQQKRQQQGRSKLSGTKLQTKSIPTRDKIQPVLKVNQQTQVRQRSRDRQREPGKGHQQVASETEARRDSPVTADAIESGRTKMPEILLRKGEVQKRVDEWLNQAHSQNFPVTREKALTRSNSSAEQKCQRRYRQDSRSRSIDEARERLNGASSSYDDLSRVDRKTDKGRMDKVNVGVNTSRAVYKEYLAVKNKATRHDYGFGASNAPSLRSGDSSPASRIPQRGTLGSSFRSRRADATSEETPEERNGRMTSRMTNLAKTRSESDYGRLVTVNNSRVSEAPAIVTMTTTSTSTTMTTTTTTMTASSIIPSRRPSLKRTGNGDQNAAIRSLVKEETESRPRGICGAGPSKGLGDQGESISPNKDGESRRPVAANGPPRSADKAVETACCKSAEAPRCAEHPQDGSRIVSPAESGSAIECSRRRLQTVDVRREAKIDQSRQEHTIYGAVGARVRALQAQAESRAPRSRCQQVTGAPMESKRLQVLPRKDLGASPSRDTASQSRAKAPITAPSSSFKPNNRVYTSASLQQLNERNITRSKVTNCEPTPLGKTRGYSSPSEHVEKIYERTLQPQVIHADDLESVLRPALQMSAYGEKAAPREGRHSPVKETLSAVESELFERVGESRHPEHLETIEEDDRKSENSVCRYPEIGLKQCLKVQQSLANGRSKETPDKRKDIAIYTRWDRQAVLNEPVRTFATFQPTPLNQGSLKSSASSRSPEIKESKSHEEIEQKPDESTIIPESRIELGYEDALRQEQEQDRLAIHSRENSNLSTTTIPVDELESQRASKFKTDEDDPSTRFQVEEKPQDREEPAKDENVDRGAVVSEVLVKNLQFEQDLPANQLAEQSRADHAVQQVNFRNVLCDDYENNDKRKDRKVHLTKEQMDHQRLIAMLKKGDFETLRMVSLLRHFALRVFLIAFDQREPREFDVDFSSV